MELIIPFNHQPAGAPSVGSSPQAAAYAGHGRTFHSELEATAQRGSADETPVTSSPTTTAARVESAGVDEHASDAPPEEVLEDEETLDRALHWWGVLAVSDHSAQAEPLAGGEGAMVGHEGEPDCGGCADASDVTAAAAAAVSGQAMPTAPTTGQESTDGSALPSAEALGSKVALPAESVGERGPSRVSLPPVSPSRSTEAQSVVGGDDAHNGRTADLIPQLEARQSAADKVEPIMFQARATQTSEGEAAAGLSESGHDEAAAPHLSDIALAGIEPEDPAQSEPGDHRFDSDQQAGQTFEFNGRSEQEVGGAAASSAQPSFVSEMGHAGRGALAASSGAPVAPGAMETPILPSASVRLDVPQGEGEPVRLHVSLVQQTVYARIVTSQTDVQEYFARHHDRLAASLEAHGLEMGQLQVDSGGREQQAPQSWWQEEPRATVSRVGETEGRPTGSEPGPVGERRSRLHIVA